MPVPGRRPGTEPVRITTAASSRDADLRARQRRYIMAMSTRTICFVGAVAVGPGWLRWVLVAGAVFLPYIAVVMANAVTTKRDDFELDAVPRDALGPGGTTHQL